MKMGTPNIILITIDSLRSDHLGCYGYTRDSSPNIDRLASKGVLFSEAIANGGCTPDSFPSILASQLPPIDDDEYRRVMRRSLTIAGLLKGAGYQTAAFHSNPYLSEFFHYNEGFNVFEDNLGTVGRRLIQQPPEEHGVSTGFNRFLNKVGRLFVHLLFALGRQPCVTADELTNQAVSWLDSHHSRFFLWLHYMDTHYPYLPPAEYVRKLFNRRISRYRMVNLYSKQLKTFREAGFRNVGWLSPAEIDTLINLYDADIRYVDDNIGRLLESLGNHLENTIIIVTADHGEAFGEHNSLGHGTLYEELIRVPLIIAGPGIKAGAVVSEPVELMDLAPTIADSVGIARVKGFHGRSLLTVVRDGQRVARGTINVRHQSYLMQRLISYRTHDLK